MNVGLFSPYFETFGGGERYILTVAEYFLKNFHSVDIFSAESYNASKIKDRFDLDLTGARFCKDIFFNKTNLLLKLWKTTGYDLIFFLSDGSVPFLFAKKNILHFQIPFNYPDQNNILNKIKFQTINKIVCNSKFTKKYIDQTYGIRSNVLYPPVDIEKFSPGKKENIILSVGRFFSPSHPKKQEILIENFKRLPKEAITGWKLILAGGITDQSRSYIDSLKKITGNYPVEFKTDVTFDELKILYSKAKIYWHAAGFGEDHEKDPAKVEHFGITTVEAMAAGCVPVVFGAGGQLEIITENKNGFFWRDGSELIKKTIHLITDKNLLETISKQTVRRSKDFSKQKFFDNLSELIK